MKLYSVFFVAMLSILPMRADGLIGLIVKDRWPAEGYVLYVVNTGSDDVPFNGVLLAGTPSGGGITAPTVRENIELGPGRSIAANGVTSGIHLKKIGANFTGKITIALERGNELLNVDKVLIETGNSTGQP
jgi:hypothetical protein